MSSPDNNMRVGIANNALVVSFLTAEAPRVWRTDMGQLLNAALEVQDSQGKHTLVMKRSGAPVEEIGTFFLKEDAIKALQLITDALLMGKGNSTSSGAASVWLKKSLKILLKIVGVLIALFIVLNIVGAIIFRHGPPVDSNYAKGVPAPADQILGK